jgi:hypothetical protein
MLDWGTIGLTGLLSVALNALIFGWWKPWTKGLAEELDRLKARGQVLDDILIEVRAVTGGAKENRITTRRDLWNRQMLWTEKKLVYAGLLTAVHQMLMYQGDMSACVELFSETVNDEQTAKLNKRLSEAIIAFTYAECEMLRFTAIGGIFASPQWGV